MKKYIDDNASLWRYIEIAATNIDGSINKGFQIQLKCNVCGDGKGKKRGYIIWDRRRDLCYYKCFNEGDCVCAGEGNSWPAARWLRTYFPALFSMYRKEVLQTHLGITNSLTDKKVIINETKTENEKEDLNKFIPITKGTGEIFKTAIDVCNARNIPEGIWKTFFVAVGGKYYGRIIIPFYDDKGKIYYFQGRDIIGRSPKYLNRKHGRDSAIYNYYNINKNEPVISLEGPIDSMFVENSIATLGLTISETVKEKLDTLNIYYLFDCDHAGFKKSAEYIKEKRYVFNWIKFKKDHLLPENIKDINDCYNYLKRKTKFTFTELSKYFTNDYYDIIYFK